MILTLTGHYQFTKWSDIDASLASIVMDVESTCLVGRELDRLVSARWDYPGLYIVTIDDIAMRSVRGYEHDRYDIAPVNLDR